MRLIDADKLKKKIRHWNYNATTSTPTFSFVTEEDIDYMPTVCDIEQIRAEIADYKDDKIIHAECNEMIDIMLEIIDKHKK